MNRHARGIIAAAFILTLIVAIAQAAERPFYQGKTVTFFINFKNCSIFDLHLKVDYAKIPPKLG